MIVRDASRGGDSCSASGDRPESAAATSSAIAGMADGLEVVASERQVVQPQHPPRGLVGQLQPAVRIDDDDAFDHAGEDGFHAGVIARLLGELPSDHLHRVVQRPRDAAELVVSVVETGGREIAAAVAFRDAGDRAHAAAHARGDDPADRGRADEREGERRERWPPAWSETAGGYR